MQLFKKVLLFNEFFYHCRTTVITYTNYINAAFQELNIHINSGIISDSLENFLSQKVIDADPAPALNIIYHQTIGSGIRV